MDQKLNGFCKHGNPALDCGMCIRAAESDGQITEKQEDGTRSNCTKLLYFLMDIKNQPTGGLNE